MKHLYLFRESESIRIAYSKSIIHYMTYSSWWQSSEKIYKHANFDKNIYAICRPNDMERLKLHVIMATQSNKSFKEHNCRA